MRCPNCQTEMVLRQFDTFSWICEKCKNISPKPTIEDLLFYEPNKLGGEKMDEEKEEILFKAGWSVKFDTTGRLTAYTESDDFYIGLSEDETAELYQAMKKYYEGCEDDK